MFISASGAEFCDCGKFKGRFMLLYQCEISQKQLGEFSF